MIGGLHQQFGVLDVQRVGVFEEGLDVLLGVLLHGEAVARGVADDLVLNVSDVHDVLELVAALLQEAAQRVDHDEGAEVADVSVVVNGGPAGIHADEVVFQRPELLNFSGQSIKELKRHEPSLWHGESLIVGGREKRGQLQGPRNGECGPLRPADQKLSVVPTALRL